MSQLVLCIVSMIRYDTYRRYIDPIQDMYRDTYRIIYSIKNIAETVIKTQHTNTRMHKIDYVPVWRVSLWRASV